MRKAIVVGVFCFIAGFFTHALFFSDLFVPNAPAPVIQDSQKTQKLRDLILQVNYENGSFKPSHITLEKGQYIAIRNMNKDLKMWLVSDEKTFNTNRGYGQGEELKNIYSEAKTFTVADKLNPSSTLTVTVK